MATSLHTTRWVALLALVAGSALWMGCGLQMAPAYHSRGRDGAAPISLEVDGRVRSARRDGPYLALAASFSDPNPRASFGMREVAVGAGYHVAWDAFAVELGPRLGVGEPAYVELDDTGMHAALDGALLYRLMGEGDRRVGYIPFAMFVDVVLQAQAGLWSQAYGTYQPEVWDAFAGVGLRLSFASDLTVSNDDSWEAR